MSLLTYQNFFQVFALQMMQRLQEILLDVIVQGVFNIGQLLHCFTGLDERSAYRRSKSTPIR